MNLVLLIAAFSQLITDTVHHQSSLTAPRVCIRGEGPNGTDPTGPILNFRHGVGDGLYLGRGAPFRATGTRIEGIRITRQGSGGTGLSIVAASAAERPGEIIIRDVLICGLSDLQGGNPDNWERGLLVDGGTLNEPGKAGIRRVTLDTVRVASVLGDSIVLRNVTHVTGTGIQVDPGTARRVPTVIVENSRHIDLQVNLFGELHIRGSDVVNVSGYAQVVYVDARCSKVNLRGVFPRVVSAGKTLERVTSFVRW